MKHVGDITKLNGAELPVVDILTGGSPCQDLSVAGKRAGLAGERSGLFMEQIRLIKEMRENDKRTNGRTDATARPRFMVWENVPGAFSSNGGEDFRAVLEETARIVDKNADVPRPAEGWESAGAILGDGWSIAWRVHDAQFWGRTIRDIDTGNVLKLGTPQRRRRIALVADFNGGSATEILFESYGLPGDFEQGQESREGTSESIGGCTDPASRVIEDWISAVNSSAIHQQDLIQSDLGIARTLASGTHASGSHLTKTLVTSGAISFQERAGCAGGGKGILIQNERTGALSTLNNQAVMPINTMVATKDKAGGHNPIVFGISSYDSNAMKSNNPKSGIYEAETARTLDLNGGNPSCNQGGMAIVQGVDVYNGSLSGDVAATLTGACAGSNTSGAKVLCVDQGGGKSSCNVFEECSPTLTTTHGGEPTICIEGNGSRPSHKGDGYSESNVMYTLNATEQHAVVDVDGFDSSNLQAMGNIGRTLSAGRTAEHMPIVVDNHPSDSRVTLREDGIFQTLSGRMGTGGNNVPLVMEEQQTPVAFSETAATRCAQDGRGGVHSQMMADPESNFVVDPYAASKVSRFTHFSKETAETLFATDYKDPPTVAYGLDRASYNQGANAKFGFSVDEEKIGCQTSMGPGAVAVDCRNGVESEINASLQASADHNNNSNNVCRNGCVVRRLTPLECTRLQGFPDGWVDIGEWTDSKGKKHKDSDAPKYKALGNSIALPFWAWMAKRMRKQFTEENVTMASLFDGIGGFPLVYSWAGVKPVWCSEIEEFCIALTKLRFPEEEK